MELPMKRRVSVRFKPEYKTFEQVRKHYYIAPHFDVERDGKTSSEWLAVSCSEYEIYDWTFKDQQKYMDSLTLEERTEQMFNNTLYKREDERKVIGTEWYYCVVGCGPYDNSPKGMKFEWGKINEDFVKEMIEKSSYVGILEGGEWGPAQITDPTPYENDEKFDIVITYSDTVINWKKLMKTIDGHYKLKPGNKLKNRLQQLITEIDGKLLDKPYPLDYVTNGFLDKHIENVLIETYKKYV